MSSARLQPTIDEQRYPLGVQVDAFLGAADAEAYAAEDQSDDGQMWRKAAFNWRRFRDLMTGHPRAAEFQALLGFHQRLAWQNIDEWLNAHHQPRHLSEPAKEAILTGQYLPKTEYKGPRFPANAELQKSLYHFWLADLYRAEFVESQFLLTSDEIELFLVLLDDRRQKANRYAIIQQAAYRLYQAKHSLQQPESSRNQLRSTRRVEACPWLPENVRAGEQPYYLWHIKGKCTVEVHTLSGRVDWTCISHTWGRWRTEKFHQISGVPWRVPDNKVFDVGNLPNYFLEHEDVFTTEYVWFDLFCIPQKPKTPILVERGKLEISRQAQIFMGAIACIAWFSYVPNWDVEVQCLHWLCLAYLRLTNDPDIYDSDGFLDDARVQANHPAQLMGNFIQRRDLGNDVPDWFSSLWTLQELYLCPHMMLMNQAFELLRDAQDSPISFESLVTIIEMANATTALVSIRGSPMPGVRDEKTYPISNWPMGPAQLIDLVIAQGLSPHYRSRTNALIQGNTRQCTGRRAEAIMSVVGATDWFRDMENQGGNLVLGMYPLAFVREVAHKTGPDFYLSQKTFKPLRQFFLSTVFPRSQSGSMLPFSRFDPAKLRGGDDVVRTSFASDGFGSSPSLTSWEITKQGHVKMIQANIVDSTDPDYRTDANVEITTSYTAYVKGYVLSQRKPKIRFHEFPKCKSKLRYTYAVQVTERHGVLLQGHRFGPSNPKRLVKFGTYGIHAGQMEQETGALRTQEEIAPQRDVNWLVI
ncbi:hypothetical protein MMC20_002402 [Loxospora ochrophaea]|nr:hypothetical protein [Loxospora ochrophaea]